MLLCYSYPLIKEKNYNWNTANVDHHCRGMRFAVSGKQPLKIWIGDLVWKYRSSHIALLHECLTVWGGAASFCDLALTFNTVRIVYYAPHLVEPTSLLFPCKLNDYTSTGTSQQWSYS